METIGNKYSFLSQKFIEWLVQLGFSENMAIFIKIIVFSAIIIFLSILANWLARKIIITLEKNIIRKTKVKWDDIFLEKKVFNRLSHIAPALIIYFTVEIAFREYPEFAVGVQKATYIYILLAVLLVTDSFINSLHTIYTTLPVAENRPIKGYVQVVKIILYFVAILLVISIVFNIRMGKLFTGLGAVAAVLLLVFKDTILGFVASIQMAAYQMVKPGDWIEMPSRKADGTVIDISLNTVKVQNWDKTIITIPTYAMVSESFQNWKGMEESGGRRIKRSVNLDMKSVKFCTPEMLEKFKKIHFLKDYIKQKEEELSRYNKENDIDDSIVVNGRRITNLGTFRKYVEEYLKNHSSIHNDMTFLVRHLQPTDKGIPMEIYVFSNDQRWANYEAIQADIFDHLLAVIPEFELQVFQSPSGEDFQKLVD
ncbi:MAG: mechanosensitive ion channel [Bacteroidales bacterium]|nr:MAG: mechanosensitive ion channel [Bacteroidales bacterium]